MEQLFDDFAENFDTHLIKDLRYKTPTFVGSRPGNRPAGAASLGRAGLGCGTGLAGAAIAPYARQLVGVDLSSKMLAKAAARDVYQRLENLELLAAMQQERDATYDLVLAADVFVYIGKLDDIVAEAKRVLRPGGLMGFSTEDVVAAGGGELPDYQLKHTVRYRASTGVLAATGGGARLRGAAHAYGAGAHRRRQAGARASRGVGALGGPDMTIRQVLQG